MLLAALAYSTTTQAQQSDDSLDMEIHGEANRSTPIYGESVRRIFAPSISGWNVVDRQRLILWVSHSRPYLITLSHRANGLSAASVIGMKRRSSSIDARFDTIIVDGFPYPIERIEKLDRATADRLLGRRSHTGDENDDESEDS